MKRTKFWMMAAILTCGLTAASLASCGGDDEQEPAPVAQVSKVRIAYSVEAEQSTLSAFHVNVYRTGEDGNTDPEAMTATTWTKTVEIPAAKLPCKVQLYTVVRPNDEAAKSSGLKFGIGKSITITSMKNDGTVADNNSQVLSKSANEVEDGLPLSDIAYSMNGLEAKWSFTVDKSGKITQD